MSESGDEALALIREFAIAAPNPPPGAFAQAPPAWAKDPFNDNDACKCGYCGSWMDVVRPGKVQCPFCCDGQDLRAIAAGWLRTRSIPLTMPILDEDEPAQ